LDRLAIGPKRLTIPVHDPLDMRLLDMRFMDMRFMAKRNLRRIHLRRLALALAIVGVAAVLPVPAGAQLFGDRPDYDQRPNRPPPPQRGFFSFPFFNPGNQSNPFSRPPAPVESYKAPPPRKLETPPTSTVVVVGDTMADWLAYGLEETLADSPEIGVVRKIRPTSGLIRYEPHNDTLDWSQAIKDVLATEKPSAIIVMLGLNDRLSIRDRVPPPPRPSAQRNDEQPAQAAGQAAPQSPPGADKSPAAQSAPDAAPQDSEQPPVAASEPQRQGPGGSYEFRTDKWAELYGKRIDDMIAALKSKGVPVLWVALPAIWGTRGTNDMSYLDELYRERAERAGIVYVDIWDGFVDENGRYVTQGPDFEGQIRRLRTGDGVHFTKVGAVKLAQYVAQDLRRVMSNRLVPVALPAPEQGSPKPGGPRPAIGPVLPLTATGGGEGGDLLGAGGRTLPVNADPIAAGVLSHGDPIAAPSGRADDFSWPRPGTDANGAADAEPEPAALTPPASPTKGAAANVAKKLDDAKGKTRPAPTPTAAQPAPRAALDGARRPPAPAGGF
jgi:hypothetical protein